jgi:hypothetical protein
MRDLPMPGSPEIRTTCPSLVFARSQRRRSNSIFLAAANQRCSGTAQGFEPALASADLQDLPRRHILAEALERDGAEVAVLEQAASQLAGARRNHHGAGLGQRLEPSGKVRRFADDRLLLGRTRADEIATTTSPVAIPRRTCRGEPAVVSSFGTASTKQSPA